MNQRKNYRHKEERLLRALSTMAVIIEHHGDTYWPIFRSLEELLEEERSKHDALAKYLPARRTLTRNEKQG